MKKIKEFFKSLMGQTILGVVSTIIANFIVEQITQFNTLKFLGQKIWELIKVIWKSIMLIMIKSSFIQRNRSCIKLFSFFSIKPKVETIFYWNIIFS